MLAGPTTRRERGYLRDDTGNRVASDLHLFQSIDMRHAYPWHFVPVRQCLCALIASVADRNYILEYRLPQFESWNRTSQ